MTCQKVLTLALAACATSPLLHSPSPLITQPVLLYDKPPIPCGALPIATLLSVGWLHHLPASSWRLFRPALGFFGSAPSSLGLHLSLCFLDSLLERLRNVMQQGSCVKARPRCSRCLR